MAYLLQKLVPIKLLQIVEELKVGWESPLINDVDTLKKWIYLSFSLNFYQAMTMTLFQITSGEDFLVLQAHFCS